MNEPNLFEYDNYRAFLKDWFAFKKETDRLSYREFSKRAGFNSPNQLMLIIQGKRNVTEESLPNYFQALEFGARKQKYFHNLVLFNQCKDINEKKIYLEEISKYWERRNELLSKEQYKYLTNWYYAAIRELVNTKDFKEDAEWISKKLGSLITEAQAKKALHILEKIKLLERDENGRLTQTNQFVTTGSETQAISAYAYHLQMIKLSEQSLLNDDATIRHHTGLTFTIQEDDYNNIKQDIDDLRSKILNYLNDREVQNKDDHLYQLNLHFFPMSKELK